MSAPSMTGVALSIGVDEADAVTLRRRRHVVDRYAASDEERDDDDGDDQEQLLRQLLGEAAEAASVASAGKGEHRRLWWKRPERLLEWSELDPWRQHGSELVLTGYRDVSGSVLACFHSWTYLHNESVSILSHAAGAVVFVYLTTAQLRLAYGAVSHGVNHIGSGSGSSSNTAADHIAAAAYLGGVAVCFTLSAAYHTLLSHSRAYAARGMALDIAGILVLMAGATAPLVHFGLSCASAHVRVAFYVGTAVLGSACVVAAAAAPDAASAGSLSATGGPIHRLLASVRGPAHGHRRAALFSGFAAVSFAAPLAWMARVTADPDWPRRVDLWPGMLGTLACNTAGATAYALRAPERWRARRFDCVGASHQLMHLAVLAAAVVYASGIERALAFRRGEGALCRNDFEV